ncbi:hypothetical protein niasHT_037741 [Heterodera trifolii]|uniref:Peptidase C1A papain C-terminal domain-containing protein n=1 Tax=Heterodera trifolii TaxID=157864 RepID=A0ABD2J7P3_9BILA
MVSLTLIRFVTSRFEVDYEQLTAEQKESLKLSLNKIKVDYNQLTAEQKENLMRSFKRIEEWNKTPGITYTLGINQFSLWSDEERHSFFRRDDRGLPKLPHRCGGKCYQIKPKPLKEERELSFVGNVNPLNFRQIDESKGEAERHAKKQCPPISRPNRHSFFPKYYAMAEKTNAEQKESPFYSEYSHSTILDLMQLGMEKRNSKWTYQEMRFLLLIGAFGRKEICLKVNKWKDDGSHRALPNQANRMGGKGQRIFPGRLRDEPELEFHSLVDPISYKPSNSAPEFGDVVCEDYRFDIRTKWPQCSEIINEVQDQSKCHCCYAVAAASVLSDRFCIAMAKRGWPVTPARLSTSFFSAGDLMQCAREERTDACRGGFSHNIWRFVHDVGVVSGHHFNQGGCKPFPFPPMSFWRRFPFVYRGKCEEKCVGSQDDGEEEYSSQKMKSKTLAGNLSTNSVFEQVIKDELFYNGSIPVDFILYNTFLDYAGGIHEHRREDGVRVGAHVVRLIGYGRVNCTDGRRVKYWLAVNSWNDNWGENGGFLRIKRGANEFGIESRDISFGRFELP